MYKFKLLMKKSLQDDEPPEITYCVVENTGTLTLQAITPTQPMPSQEELDAKFAELVVGH
jgi:dishevelled associated activator of morphogenesis